MNKKKIIVPHTLCFRFAQIRKYINKSNNKSNMVLEYLYPLKLIEKNPIYAFLLGLCYSIIGIGTALLLFPEDPALVSVAFIAIMFYPTINSLMKQEEKIETKKKDLSPILFFKNHKNIFKVYALAFLGIFLSFALFSMILPSLKTNYIFDNQINVLYGNTGKATGAAINTSLLRDLFSNNLSVLILAFITAFLIGDGAIFLIAWNASVWGTIFGTLAKNAAIKGASVGWAVCKTPANCFSIIMLIVFLHMIIEAFAYMCSATAGGSISKAILKEKVLSKRFKTLLVNTALLIIFALIILWIGALIETYVLTNSNTYGMIIRQSFL